MCQGTEWVWQWSFEKRALHLHWGLKNPPCWVNVCTLTMVCWCADGLSTELMLLSHVGAATFTNKNEYVVIQKTEPWGIFSSFCWSNAGTLLYNQERTTLKYMSCPCLLQLQAGSTNGHIWHICAPASVTKVHSAKGKQKLAKSFRKHPTKNGFED